MNDLDYPGADDADCIDSVNGEKRASAGKSGHVSEIAQDLRAILSLELEVLDRMPEKDDHVCVMQTMRESCARISAAVGDLMIGALRSSSNLDARIHNLSPSVLVDDVVGLLQPPAALKRLTLEVRNDTVVPNTICADVAILRQILLMLLGNAIRHTECGAITVELEMEAVDAESLSIHVLGDFGDPGDPEFGLCREMATGMGGGLESAQRHGANSYTVKIPVAADELELRSRV